ncbi:MAG: hypothetical protein WA659_04850 [Candidatus Aquirickettsiella sp.]
MTKLIEKAILQEWQYRNATQQALLKFKQELHPLLHDLSPDELIKLEKNVLDKLKTDKELIISLNKALESYPAGTDATWSLKTNKMLEILDGAISFIELEFDSFIVSIKEDSELAHYHIKTGEKDITIIANTGSSIYGTSKASFLKTALINIYLVCQGKNLLSEIDINNSDKEYWIDHTPNAHVTPLPDKLNPEDIKVNDVKFTQCTYFYNDAKTPKGLAFIHSGYAFGSYRNEPRYPYQPPKLLGKLNGPEDCSSFIGKLTLETDQISTADLWKRWQYQREGYPSDQAWENSKIGKLLINNYAVIEPNKVQPGDIWATRSFDKNKDPEMKGYGKGGHTVLVVDNPDKNEVMTLGYNRNMPENEGFGEQKFPMYSKPSDGKRIFFFRVNSSALEPQEPKPFLDCCKII